MQRLSLATSPSDHSENEAVSSVRVRQGQGREGEKETDLLSLVHLLHPLRLLLVDLDGVEQLLNDDPPVLRVRRSLGEVRLEPSETSQMRLEPARKESSPSAASSRTGQRERKVTLETRWVEAMTLFLRTREGQRMQTCQAWGFVGSG